VHLESCAQNWHILSANLVFAPKRDAACMTAELLCLSIFGSKLLGMRTRHGTPGGEGGHFLHTLDSVHNRHQTTKLDFFLGRSFLSCNCKLSGCV
jgi:hypothetical protein